ncbi:hypothetical protein PHYBLDRAFT_73092 [Phycomyces blakesleeanus NRRL 1555(-)]|uniref:SWIM-type domain-containing protein n=1 Tax=Phycomyces blakesleeanus (strain ATCC 8743b / DSM 1359 / FGSC 10004 / NBRC 33097 / NRRL 1555) TaxID=763407 RepID=A0A162PGT8_PHYB8|nr:hypothetical protein PHYBLDRAFT_73092 [Phycomyces blakesleeanus NRRL 1555(-)]OAD72687.1 hypothetical protein PHYBLDRAFT_73092 [Phycomyces blakesleeanus NRRL 1555(-)]|eukprot:XP_018290727.1 hypothetical protein PHYBLDRAFT_73092 [Phycomyces blakesleeanus NRRL 1555(-)]
MLILLKNFFSNISIFVEIDHSVKAAKEKQEAVLELKAIEQKKELLNVIIFSAINVGAKKRIMAATFHTNNLIESYYNQLKTFYLGRARSLRVDRLIYLLAKVLTLDYRQENVKTLYGFQSNGFLQNCTCPDTSKLCKHIFLINCILDISYSLRQSLSSSPSAVYVSNTDTKAVVDTSLLSDEIEADIMKYRQLYSVELDSKIAEYKGIPEDMSQFLNMLKFAYKKQKEHGFPSQSRPPQQT